MSRPLLPILRVGSVLALGALLLYRPRPRASVLAPVPAVWVTDLGPEAPQVLSLPPPPKPFPRQLTTCRPRVHVQINGGCWRRLADGPPCEEAYLWQGACYLPVMTAEAVPTSIKE
jgi:hypothetical protein